MSFQTVHLCRPYDHLSGQEGTLRAVAERLCQDGDIERAILAGDTELVRSVTS
jgi:hypothetical protein